MPPACTTSWSPFPPRTREAQFDEKWAFVAKEGANGDRSDRADDRKGGCRDHVAPDPDHRPVVAAVPGKRTAENAEAPVREFHRRASGRPNPRVAWRACSRRSASAAAGPAGTGWR